jgi:hypothetical protein
MRQSDLNAKHQTSALYENSHRIFIEQYNVSFRTLMLAMSDPANFDEPTQSQVVVCRCVPSRLQVQRVRR